MCSQELGASKAHFDYGSKLYQVPPRHVAYKRIGKTTRTTNNTTTRLGQNS